MMVMRQHDNVKIELVDLGSYGLYDSFGNTALRQHICFDVVSVKGCAGICNFGSEKYDRAFG